MLNVEVSGLENFGLYFEMAPKNANKAAALAINQTALRKAIPLGRKAMLAQIAWPPRYLDEGNPRRFGLKYRATESQLEAAIVGRERPTSLARFTGRTSVPPRGTKLSVRIQTGGGRRELKHSFMLRLRNENLGVGVRLKKGEMLHNTIGAKLITSGPLTGVALLYGPSVEQVFSTVAMDISPPVLAELQTEFLRQFARLQSG